MTLASAFGKTIESVRTRSFELGKHTFKVKVPLTAQTDAMFERIRNVDEEKAQAHYVSLSQEFLENKDKYSKDSEIVYKDDDIVVKGYSLRETARNKVMTETRVVEMFKLLVPDSKDFDMNSITYKEIDELFPFAIQLEIVEEITKVIAPNYTDSRKK
jgi:hypothetical protein